MFTRIFIDNYQCFTNFEFAPQRINLLLGANGSGKSALLTAIKGVALVVGKSAAIGEVFDAGSQTRWDSRTSQRMEFDVALDGHSFRYQLVVDQEEDVSMIREERVTVDSKPLFSYNNGKVHLHKKGRGKSLSIPFAGTRSFLGQIEQARAGEPLTIFKRWMSEVWRIGLNTGLMDATSHEEDPVLDQDGQNFADWYRHLAQEDPKRLRNVWKTLGEALPGFKRLKFEGRGRSIRRNLVAVMTFGSDNYELYFDELSDGQRALIVLYTLLGTRGGYGCLLFDEPEVHVGLSEVQPWLVKLDDLFADRGQVFLASHNPEVIDYMAASHPVWFERPDGGPARVRPAIFDRESGLSASQQLTHGLYDAE